MMCVGGVRYLWHCSSQYRPTAPSLAHHCPLSPAHFAHFLSSWLKKKRTGTYFLGQMFINPDNWEPAPSHCSIGCIHVLEFSEVIIWAGAGANVTLWEIRCLLKNVSKLGVVSTNRLDLCSDWKCFTLANIKHMFLNIATTLALSDKRNWTLVHTRRQSRHWSLW